MRSDDSVIEKIVEIYGGEAYACASNAEIQVRVINL
jgi:hypothetical protein